MIFQIPKIWDKENIVGLKIMEGIPPYWLISVSPNLCFGNPVDLSINIWGENKVHMDKDVHLQMEGYDVPIYSEILELSIYIRTRMDKDKFEILGNRPLLYNSIGERLNQIPKGLLEDISTRQYSKGFSPKAFYVGIPRYGSRRVSMVATGKIEDVNRYNQTAYCIPVRRELAI